MYSSNQENIAPHKDNQNNIKGTEWSPEIGCAYKINPFSIKLSMQWNGKRRVRIIILKINKQQTKNPDLYHIIPEKQCATDHRPKCKKPIILKVLYENKGTTLD